jgi:hypothetical protein
MRRRSGSVARKRASRAGPGEDAVIPAVGGESTLKECFNTFLEEKRHALGVRSYNKYKRNLEQFFKHTAKRYASHVTREDIIGHLRYLIDDRDLEEQTAKSDTIVVLTACRWGGAHIKLDRCDWPKVDKKDVEVYDIEDQRSTPDPVRRARASAFLPCSRNPGKHATSAWLR